MRTALRRGPTYAELTNREVFARNRRGEILPTQADSIREMLKMPRQSVWMAGFGAVLIIVLTWVSLFGAAQAASSATQSALTTWVPQLLFIVIVLTAEVVMIRWGIRSWREIQQTEADLRLRRIAVGEGEVRWGRGHYKLGMYVLQLADRTLRMPAFALQLPPGHYRCVYLAESGWLLAAQPIDEPANDLLAVTAKAHGFTLADLEANRAGLLSTGQRRRLQLAVIGWTALALSSSLILLGLVFGGITQPASIDQRSIVFSILLLAAAAGAIYFYRKRRHVLQAAHPIQAVEGTLSINYQIAGRSMQVFYVIGAHSIKLSELMVMRQAYNSVLEQGQYRIYYWAHSRMLAGLELIEPISAAGASRKKPRNKESV